uniref:Uncharacterized protein n=1 Tax=Trypanosoma congolense (strain IL3000) TaxID=1068625 RepID=G0USA4_TRYCI|nr:hypothetical protein, unlikely [Trypanosoma congolense IL3000]
MKGILSHKATTEISSDSPRVGKEAPCENLFSIERSEEPVAITHPPAIPEGARGSLFISPAPDGRNRPKNIAGMWQQSGSAGCRKGPRDAVDALADALLHPSLKPM